VSGALLFTCSRVHVLYPLIILLAIPDALTLTR